MTTFRLAYVPGATPAKWVRTWGERQPAVPLELVPVAAADATDLVRSRGADAALLRSPIDRDGLHAIPLYTETSVVVVPKDHLIAAADEVSTADFADDVVLRPLDDTLEWPSPPGRAGDSSARRRRRRRSSWRPRGWACWWSRSPWPACTTAAT